MNLKTTLAIAAFLAFLAGPTVAFEEQTTGSSATTKAKAAPTAAAVPAPQDLGTPKSLGKSDGGTEIRIPGLGKLGELPKMDFGLELLYGATEVDKPVEDSVDPEATTDDLRIRGTIKHQF